MRLTHARGCCGRVKQGVQGVRCTVVAVAGAGPFVDEDGHELVLSIRIDPRLQRLRPRHGEDASHIQLQGDGELVGRLHLAQLLHNTGT